MLGAAGPTPPGNCGVCFKCRPLAFVSFISEGYLLLGTSGARGAGTPSAWPWDEWLLGPSPSSPEPASTWWSPRATGVGPAPCRLTTDRWAVCPRVSGRGAGIGTDTWVVRVLLSLLGWKPSPRAPVTSSQEGLWYLGALLG